MHSSLRSWTVVTKPIFILIFAAVVSMGTPVLAQKKSSAQDPQDKPRKIRQEPDDAFNKWIEDVGPIITSQELKAWKELDNNTERERFIEEFWDRRKPDRDSTDNEYREAYYERIAYVNEHFSSGIPGYKTDRGRVYLKYGKPDEVESHPAGGAYQREPSEGGGSTSTYPFERWFYRNIPGRPGANIEFVDPTSTGEYRLANNPFEKDALLMVPGAGATTAGISQADLVAASHGVGNPFSFSEDGSPFNWMELRRIIEEPLPAPRNDRFGNVTGTPKIEDNPLGFETSFGFFKLDDNRVITTITVQADNAELSFNDSGGVQVAGLNITGRIVNVAGRRVNFFEDAVSTTATTEELIEARKRKSAYQKTVVLLPGHYKADLMIRDTRSGATGIRNVGFTVPKFGAELAVSSMILCSVLQHVTGDPQSRQFMIGDQKVIPNISGVFHRGSPVGLYLQIYNAGTDQTTLRPALEVDYALLKDGREIEKQAEDWRAVKTSGERLTLSRMIDSRVLTPGLYAIELRVRDRVTGQTLTQKEKFTIAP
jgi:GWxTD domain-containing protein